MFQQKLFWDQKLSGLLLAIKEVRISHGVGSFTYTGHHNLSAGDSAEMVNEMRGMFFCISNSESF